MLHADYLYTISELSAVLTGFSALIFAVGSDAREGFGRYVLEQLVRRGIFVAGIALLPILMASFELPEKTIWSICSGILATLLSVLAVTGIKQRIQSGGFASPWSFYPRYLIGLGATIALWFNVYWGLANIFLLGVTVLLGLTAMLLIGFVSLVIARDA